MSDLLDSSVQFGRKIQLLVIDRSGGNTGAAPLDPGIDLSELRIKFSVKRSALETPNTADIRVYNLTAETALQIQAIQKIGRTQVILQAGYEGNFGVIFRGNIKQVLIGRESATDTYLDIIAGDGDQAYNYAIVNTTVGKARAGGTSQSDQVSAAITSMTPKGVTAGHLGDFPATKLPRGKVMFGNARNYLRNSAKSAQKYWSIQDEKVTFVDKKAYLPGEAVLLSSATGLIGTPQQTNIGVNVKCLINPSIQINTRIKLDQSVSIVGVKLDLNQIAAAKGDVSQINKILPRALNADGVYYVLTFEQVGDTRGVEWYTNLICLSVDVTTNPVNSVQPGYG